MYKQKSAVYYVPEEESLVTDLLTSSRRANRRWMKEECFHNYKRTRFIM